MPLHASATLQLLGFYMEKNKKFKMAEDFTEKHVTAFAESVIDGTAQAEFKSAPIPEDPKDGECVFIGRGDPGWVLGWRVAVSLAGCIDQREPGREFQPSSCRWCQGPSAAPLFVLEIHEGSNTWSLAPCCELLRRLVAVDCSMVHTCMRLLAETLRGEPCAPHAKHAACKTTHELHANTLQQVHHHLHIDRPPGDMTGHSQAACELHATRALRATAPHHAHSDLQSKTVGSHHMHVLTDSHSSLILTPR